MQTLRAHRRNGRFASTILAVLAFLFVWYQYGLPYIVSTPRSAAVAHAVAACGAGGAVRLSGSVAMGDALILTLEDYVQRFAPSEAGTFRTWNAPPTTLVWRVTVHGSRQFVGGPPPAQNTDPDAREAPVSVPESTGACEALIHATTGVLLRIRM